MSYHNTNRSMDCFKLDIIGLRGPGGVCLSILTYLLSYLIIWLPFNKTIPKPYIFWNLGSIERHFQCSSKNLTICSEMPASYNGQLQMQYQATVNVILTTLLNRFQCQSPGLHKKAISGVFGGWNLKFQFWKKMFNFL